jgi:hypothetical protein
MGKEIQKDNENKIESSAISNTDNAEVSIRRCFDMLTYISNSAAEIISDVIQNNPCDEAKRFLLDWPEEIAVRAYRKVLEDLAAMQQNRLNKNFH